MVFRPYRLDRAGVRDSESETQPRTRNGRQRQRAGPSALAKTGPSIMMKRFGPWQGRGPPLARARRGLVTRRRSLRPAGGSGDSDTTLARGIEFIISLVVTVIY